MRLFNKARVETRGAFDTRWSDFSRNPLSGGGASDSLDSASQHSVVFACWDLLSDIVSSLPFRYFDKRGQELKGEGGEFSPLFSSPSPHTNILLCDWIKQIVISQMSRGNAYGWVVDFLPNGFPSSIEILHPDDVKVTVKQGEYTWSINGSKEELFGLGGRLVHLPEYVFPGSPVGVSPLTKAMRDINLGLKARNYGERFFDGSGTPTFVITGDAPVTDTQAQTVKERVIASSLGYGREPLVLGGGYDAKPLMVNPEESQFLRTIGANATTITRYYRIDPTLIGVSFADPMTYRNAQDRLNQFLITKLRPYLTRFNQRLSTLVPNGITVSLDTSPLFAMIPSDAVTVGERAVRSGLKSRNEVRNKWLNSPPIEGGDELLWPPYRAFPLDSDKE